MRLLVKAIFVPSGEKRGIGVVDRTARQLVQAAAVAADRRRCRASATPARLRGEDDLAPGRVRSRGRCAGPLMCVTCCLSVPFCFIVQTWTGPPPWPEQ